MDITKALRHFSIWIREGFFKHVLAICGLKIVCQFVNFYILLNDNFKTFLFKLIHFWSSFCICGAFNLLFTHFHLYVQF